MDFWHNNEVHQNYGLLNVLGKALLMAQHKRHNINRNCCEYGICIANKSTQHSEDEQSICYNIQTGDQE